MGDSHMIPCPTQDVCGKVHSTELKGTCDDSKFTNSEYAVFNNPNTSPPEVRNYCTKRAIEAAWSLVKEEEGNMQLSRLSTVILSLAHCSPWVVAFDHDTCTCMCIYTCALVYTWASTTSFPSHPVSVCTHEGRIRKVVTLFLGSPPMTMRLCGWKEPSIFSRDQCQEYKRHRKTSTARTKRGSTEKRAKVVDT